VHAVQAHPAEVLLSDPACGGPFFRACADPVHPPAAVAQHFPCIVPPARLDAARARVKGEGAKIIARDIDPEATDIARKNARAAKVAVLFEHAPVSTLGPTSPPGVIVTNPPWGERLEADRGAWLDLGEALDRLRDHAACVLAGTPEIPRAIRRKPAKTHVVFNGPIECRALVYE